MKSCFGLILALTTSVVCAQTPDSLTIEQAIVQVVDNHPLVRQAAESVDASLAHLQQKRSAYYPTSDVDLTYTRLDPVGEIAFPGLGAFQMYPEDNYDEHISVHQTVYDFGRTSASVEVNEWNVKSGEKRVDLIKTELAFQTVQTFYAILFLRQNIEVKNREIDALNEHLSITQKKAQAGTATDFDVLTTQVRIAAEKNRRADIENMLQKQESVFRRLVQLSPDADIRIRGSFDVQPSSLNPDSLLSVAKDDRIEILQAHDQEQMAQADEKLASIGDRPELRVDLAYGLKNGFFPDLDVWRGNWVAAVDAKIPIFNGFKTENEKEESHAKYLAALEQSRNIERQVQMEVQQAVSDMQTSVQKIETSTLEVQQAEQALSMANVRYSSGVITNLDLIDAQTSLAEAQLSHLDALYKYVISTYTLRKAVGENFIPKQ